MTLPLKIFSPVTFVSTVKGSQVTDTCFIVPSDIVASTSWGGRYVSPCFTVCVISVMELIVVRSIAFTTFSIINRQAVTDPAVAININEELSKLPDTTIENYLTTEVVNIEPNTIAYQEVKDEDITAFLKEFTEEDLQQYLKNEGEDVTSN